MATTRLRTANAIGVAAILLAACGGGVEGTPVAELWDPCSIPAPLLEGAGLELGSTTPRRIDTGSDTWQYCSYRSDWAFVSIISTTTNFDAVANDSRASGRRDVELGTQLAVLYVIPGSSTFPSCYLTTPHRAGSLQFRVAESGLEPPTDDVCARVYDVARALFPLIPR